MVTLCGFCEDWSVQGYAFMGGREDCLVGCGGFAWGFEGFGEEGERSEDQGDDSDDVEDVHEGQELRLGVELVVDASVGCVECVGGREAVRLQIRGGLVDVLL